MGILHVLIHVQIFGIVFDLLSFIGNTGLRKKCLVSS